MKLTAKELNHPNKLKGLNMKIAITADIHLTSREKNPERFHGLENILDKLTYFQEIPTEGPGLYPQWYVMKKAKEKIKVLLLEGLHENSLTYFDAVP